MCNSAAYGRQSYLLRLIHSPSFSEVKHSRQTPYDSHQKLLSQSPPSSFSIIQHLIRYANLLRDYISLKRDFAALAYQHAALLRAQSAR